MPSLTYYTLKAYGKIKKYGKCANVNLPLPQERKQPLLYLTGLCKQILGNKRQLREGMIAKMVLEKSRAGLVVERFGDKRKKRYKLAENAVCVVNAGTKIEALSQIDRNATVWDAQGNERILQMGEFFITMETIDPYHIIMDMV